MWGRLNAAEKFFSELHICFTALKFRDHAWAIWGKAEKKNVFQTSFELRCLLVTCVQFAMIEPVFVLVAGLLWKCC